MANNAINIHKGMCVPVPSQYLDFQSYMFFIVISDAKVRGGFVDIDEIVDLDGVNL